MQTLIRILVGIVVLAVTLTAAAYLLPGSYHVQRSVEIQAPAEVVFAQVNDLKHWQAWTIWGTQDPQLKYEMSSVSVGVGAWQKWSGPESGEGELSITASEPPSRVAYALFFPDFNARSTGEILIAPAAKGVTVTWTNGGNLGANPIMRWFGLLFDRWIGGDFAAGLERLKARCETVAASAVPVMPEAAVAPEAVVAPEAPVAPEVPAVPEATPVPADR